MTETDLGAPDRRAGEPVEPGAETPAPGNRPRRQLSNYLLVPTVAFAVVFLIFQLPKYSALDPNQAQRPLESVTQYWLLVGHVAAGTLSLVTVVLQLWPWLRRRYPAFHRWSGRLYVFVGAIPTSIFVLLMLPVSIPAGKVGGAVAAILWTATALIGWVKLRQRRYAEHRRWMIYSFAILWGTPVWGFFIGMGWIWWSPWVAQIDFNYILEGVSWGGWIINLFIVQWWIEKTSGQPLKLPPGEMAGMGRRG
ncbi:MULTISPECIES: DUF2306 domain-containing protein [unclassified Streptosporangium]|uniref:DUF2306 domain-containing protein n=1 Tax=unclassified Streptosporangium TaxID=2632669 RepID=UPI002E2A1F0C|nr:MULTISPECIES: DUF2306 domain-containing protein [unclassified Streptosporangium]